jgi:TRAP-type C4-dicarboxylate transport system substrate-binding protein
MAALPMEEMEKQSKRRTRVGRGLCLLLLAGWPWISTAQQQGAAATRELTLSTAMGPAYPLGKAGQIWAARIGERSAGRLAARHVPGAALSQRDPGREFAVLQGGGADLAVGSSLWWSQQIPELNVFTLPWLASNDAGLDALVGDPVVRAILAQRLQRAGVVAVEWCANGFLELATRSAVHRPADLDRSRIRIVRSPLIEDTLAALGAAPTTMPPAEARAAAAGGALDGQLTSVAAYAAARTYADGFAHLLLWNAQADALVFAVNGSVWAALAEDDRATIREAAKDAARLVSAMSRDLSGDSELSALARQSVAVNRLTPAGEAAYRQATRAVYEKWSTVIGADLVGAAEAAVASARPPR